MGVTSALSFVRSFRRTTMGLCNIARGRLVFDSASFLTRMFMGSPGRWEALTLLLLDVLLVAGFEIIVRRRCHCTASNVNPRLSLPAATRCTGSLRDASALCSGSWRRISTSPLRSMSTRYARASALRRCGRGTLTQNSGGRWVYHKP
jgi:hypothetical protein